VQVKATIARRRPWRSRRPGLARFVAKQAVDSFFGKAPLPAPYRRTTDAGAARHFRHRQSIDGEEYDFRALHVLEGVVAIADYPLEAFDVEGAWRTQTVWAIRQTRTSDRVCESYVWLGAQVAVDPHLSTLELLFP